MRIVKETAWLITGQAISAISVLVGVRVLTSITAPHVYGEYSLWLGALLLLYSAFCWPLLQGVLRLYPDVQRQGKLPTLLALARREITWRSSAFVGLVLFGGAGYSFFSDSSFEKFVLLAALFVVESVKGFGMTILAATRQQRSFALQTGLDAVLRQACAIGAGLIFGVSVESLVAGTLCGGLTAVVILWVRLMSRIEVNKTRTLTDTGLLTELRSFSRPLIPLAISGWVSGMSDRYIIASFAGTEAAGIYAATYGLISKPFLTVGTTTELALRQLLYQAVSAGDHKRERGVMRAWLGLNTLAGLLGSIAVWLLGEHIGRILLGEEFRSGIALAPWIAGGYAMLLISQALERNAYAHKNTIGVLKIQMSGALISILCVIPATALLGMPGAAYIAPLYFGLQALIAYFISSRNLKWA